MFDVSFSELMLIGVIALIVIGPERLPKVARTLGHLVGRAQRYVSDVKSDIQRELDLDDLTSLKGQMEDAARSVKTSMQSASDSLKEPMEEARQALKEASSSIENLTTTVTEEAGPQPQASEPAGSNQIMPPAQPVDLAAPVPPAPMPAGTPDEIPEPDTKTLPLPGFDNTGSNQPPTGKTP